MSKSTDKKKENPAKFIICSLLGVFLFFTPIPDGDGAFNIFLGIVINWLNYLFSNIEFGYYAPDTMDGTLIFSYGIALAAISVSFLGTVVAQTFKPKFIMNNPSLKNIFVTSPVYFATRAIAFAIVWMFFANNGPQSVIHAFTGDVVIGLVAGLVTIFLVFPMLMPLLTEFGLMEFLGTLVRKFVRKLFTLPGRASVDLMASWFGSSVVAVLITGSQLNKGFYTRREAAVSATNFATVSVPFTFIVVSQIGIQAHFLIFYVVMSLTVIALALIMPRIWPLRNIPNTYIEDVGKQIKEDVPLEGALFATAVKTASAQANKTTKKDFLSSVKDNYLSMFLDLLPIILAWGTFALMINELTDIFEWVSQPMGYYLQLLQIEGAFDYAPATLVGFADMFIPAILLGSAPLHTQFVLGVLSIVQLIYLAETGALIIKSKIPLSVSKLFIIFMMRTLIGLPIIVLLTRLLFNP